MFQQLGVTLAALYPTKQWGCLDDAGLENGVCSHDSQLLAEEFASCLQASTFFREGEEDEYCSYVYVLCIGREPSLVQIRDGNVPIPQELEGQSIEEVYLRVCVSHLARMAGVQQVTFTMEPDGNNWLITEKPRAGVYDAPLLARFQRLVAILPSYDILHVDFGEISAPPAGFAPGSYQSLYGGVPSIVNYLFYPQPATMIVTTF